ncbi:MAG: hypothetical protein ACR2OZ_01980 [Verrucomicrobiales bacterium]
MTGNANFATPIPAVAAFGTAVSDFDSAHVRRTLDGSSSIFTLFADSTRLDTATTLKVRDNVPVGTPPARFLRVKVTAAP